MAYQRPSLLIWLITLVIASISVVGISRTDESAKDETLTEALISATAANANETTPSMGFIAETNEKKRPLKIVMVLVDPFTMIRDECRDGNESACSGKLRYEGYCIDLLHLLSDLIPEFPNRYDIVLADGNRYGAAVNSDGSWNGAMGQLLSGDAEIAIAPMRITAERQRVVDFTAPFMNTGLTILIKKPDTHGWLNDSLWLLFPLSMELWILIGIGYLVGLVLLLVVSRCARPMISARIIAVSLILYTIAITSVYIAALTANLLSMKEVRVPPINNIDDLAKQTKIKYGVVAGGSTADYFKYSVLGAHQRMWRFMQSQPESESVFVKNYAEGIERVRSSPGHFAFILESTVADYANARQPCDTLRVGENFATGYYAVATPQGSPWKERLNQAILALHEGGELKKLELKWWTDRAHCWDESPSHAFNGTLELSHLVGVFAILAVGLMTGMVIGLLECIVRKKRN